MQRFENKTLVVPKIYFIEKIRNKSNLKNYKLMIEEVEASELSTL